MAAMCAGDVVITAEGLAHSHGNSLLTNIEVSKPRHFASGVELIDVLFKHADLEHLLVHMQPLFTAPCY